MGSTTRSTRRARALAPDASARAGVLLAALGAISYGVTVVVGEDLADAHFGPSTSLGFRFAVGGLLLAVVLRIRRVPLFPSRRVVLTGLGLGAIYAVESTMFFSSLEHMTAAATALVFYVYPAMVTVVEIVRGREQPHRSTFIALGLSLAGTAIVVAGGKSVDVSAAGVAFALGAAATFAVYLLVGRDAGRRADPMTTACLVAIGASACNLAKGAAFGDLVDPTSRTLEIGLYGLATAVAFTLMFAAVQRASASSVAVVMTLEVVASVALAALFLAEPIRLAQAIGGVGVLAAAIVIARTQPDVATAEADAPDGGP